jgi:hypothetical protein
MSTKVEKPLEGSPLTHVADMPPLEVVTVGIPDQEHLQLPPSAQSAPPVVEERRGRMWAWALAGVMGLLLVVAGVFAFARSMSTGDLTVVPPVGSDVVEPASGLPYSGPLEGPALPYMAVSIPEIPAIAEVSVPSLPTIAPMPAMSIPTIADISIAPMAMSIPRIPEISIPSNPSDTPGTPATPSTPIAFPAISVPTIRPITFPSFPAIAEITVPEIPDFPVISIPPFPDM